MGVTSLRPLLLLQVGTKSATILECKQLPHRKGKSFMALSIFKDIEFKKPGIVGLIYIIGFQLVFCYLLWGPAVNLWFPKTSTMFFHAFSSSKYYMAIFSDIVLILLVANIVFTITGKIWKDKRFLLFYIAVIACISGLFCHTVPFNGDRTPQYIGFCIYSAQMILLGGIAVAIPSLKKWFSVTVFSVVYFSCAIFWWFLYEISFPEIFGY